MDGAVPRLIKPIQKTSPHGSRLRAFHSCECCESLSPGVVILPTDSTRAEPGSGDSLLESTLRRSADMERLIRLDEAARLPVDFVHNRTAVSVESCDVIS